MKVFVTGVNGQLGYDVINEVLGRGYQGIGSDIQKEYKCFPDETNLEIISYMQMDITNATSVSNILNYIRPDVVIHCAAWTAVDLAEDTDKQEIVHQVNTIGTRNIAIACRKLECKMVYISSDYVFDGKGSEPWRPECQNYNPLNVYGRTKLEGEFAVSRLLNKYFIVRIAWVFGKNGKNFVRAMLDLGRIHNKLLVVNDQIGTPTYTYDLARLLVDMIETEKYGYYHVTNEGGYISWYDFAIEIFQQATRQGHSEYDINHLTVIPVTTEEYGISKARRPFNSRLDKSKLSENGFTLLPTWQNALARYLNDVYRTEIL